MIKNIIYRLFITVSLLLLNLVLSEKLTDYLYTKGFKSIGINSPINDNNLFYCLFVLGCFLILLLNSQIKIKK